ncbi:MAG: hypothetical protein NVSMB46_08070 [Candidatus Saccharimonadales bacterium]
MSALQKDTIYIDIDDEITNIIEKVRNSPHKIVALVLPKRATVLQSSINMKLLKRAADTAKKQAVLITSETNLLPLAGAAGIYVAKTLQTKPELPSGPVVPSDSQLEVSEDDGELPLDVHQSVGALAGAPLVNDEEPIEVDNSSEEDSIPEAAAIEAGLANSSEKPKINKKLKVPSFEKFRLGLFLSIFGLIGLVVLWYVAFFVLPKARITVRTNTATINSDVPFTATTGIPAVDLASKTIPLQKEELKKSDSNTVPATGKIDQGTKSTGTLTLTNCINDNQSHTVPAGTGFSSGQYTFVTNKDVTLAASYSPGGDCKVSVGTFLGFTQNVGVTAAQAGGQYNLSARSYTSPITGITATGSDMSGGTSNIIVVVSQQDIDGAKQKIIDADNAAAPDVLKKQALAANEFFFADTFSGSTPEITSSVQANDKADQVTVNVAITYTLLAVKKDDVKQLIDNDIKTKIDSSKQKITNDGIAQSTVHLVDKTSAKSIKAEVQATALAGAEENVDAIKQLAAGKKKGVAVSAIQTRPGIQSVDIKYSPFWISQTPKDSKKIFVEFKATDGSR